jgi:hypothetical protein
VTWRFDVATFLCLQLSDEQKCACVDSWKSTTARLLRLSALGSLGNAIGAYRAHAALPRLNVRLTVEVIAGKAFTTLNEIERMRGRCRVEVRVPVSTSDQPATRPESSPIKPLGSSGTAQDITPLDALNAKLQRLSKSSRTILQKNTRRRARNKI